MMASTANEKEVIIHFVWMNTAIPAPLDSLF